MFSVHVNICGLDAAPGITGDKKIVTETVEFPVNFQWKFFNDFCHLLVQYKHLIIDRPIRIPYVLQQFLSSLVMGDKNKMSESETTHSASFHYTQRYVSLYVTY